MSNTKHTPGPWYVQDNTDQDGDGHQLRVDSDEGVVAQCGRKPFVDEQSRANAALIAAAPEMFAALKRLVDGGCPAFVTKAVERAIAKAEGRT